MWGGGGRGLNGKLVIGNSIQGIKCNELQVCQQISMYCGTIAHPVIYKIQLMLIKTNV